MKKALSIPGGAPPVGPYSPAVVAGGWVWISGQIALDPQTGQLVAGGIEAQTRRAMDNVKALLEAAGSSLEQVVRATVWLVSMEDFAAMNRVYATYFEGAPPARVCVEVSRLPKDAKVEIDAVALSGSGSAG